MENGQTKGENTLLEITDDPANAREIVRALVVALRGKDGKPASREVALAVTKLQEADHWLFEAMVSGK